MDRQAMISTLWQAKLSGAISDSSYFLSRFLLSEARRDGKTWFSQETLAQKIGRSVRTVGRSIAQLAAVGFLEVTPRRMRWNRRGTNILTLRLPQVIHKRLKRKKETYLDSSSATVSDGSATGSLARLADLMGVAVDAVMPWLFQPKDAQL